MGHFQSKIVTFPIFALEAHFDLEIGPEETSHRRLRRPLFAAQNDLVETTQKAQRAVRPGGIAEGARRGHGVHGNEAVKRGGDGIVGATHAYICAEKEMAVRSMAI